MKKKFGLFVIAFSLMVPLFSCSSETENSNVPDNELTRIFEKLKSNNFSVEHQERRMSNDSKWQSKTFLYTEYAVEQHDGAHYTGVAQGDEEIFRYDIVDDEIVVGLPLLNSSNGVRYDSVFQYTYGLQDIDLSALPTKKDAEGWYIYEFEKSKVNDNAILPVFLRYSPQSPILPESLRMRVVGENLELDCVLLDNKWEDQPDAKDIAFTTVYDIGKTENPEIKAYLDSGKTSKKPLDMRFYKMINPYLSSHNFTVSTDTSAFSNSDVDYKIKYTEDAQTIETDSTYYGFVYANRYISQFNKEDDKLKIITTPRLDESSYYTYLYGEKIEYSFTDILFDNLIGYIDEEHENSYILTDSQFIYVLGYICNVYISSSQYASSVRIEILNDNTKTFKVYFDFVNMDTHRNLGTYVATLSDLNNTKIPEVDRYLAKGKMPSTQEKEEFINVMNKFKAGNYSLDLGIGKYYFTENYRYFESFTSEYSDYGLIKLGNSVYEFDVRDGEVQVDTKTDYASLNFPSTGSYLFADDDFGYLSTFHPEQLYDFDKYYVSSSCGEEYWKNDALSTALYNYLMATPPINVILPQGTGIMVQDGKDPYDTRVTFIATYSSVDETQVGSTSFTFYDIGSTSKPLLEEYLRTQVN